MGGLRERTTPSKALPSVVFCLGVCLIVACSPALSKSPVSGREGAPATVSAITDKLFPTPDEDLFCEGIAHLGVSGKAADYDRAKAAFAAIVQFYPKSKWTDPARTCLAFIEERRILIEKSARDQGLIDTLRQEKEEALRNKESSRLANEKLQAEAGRLLQENEQLKKDIQLLKELEVELEKRDRMLK